MRLANDKKAVFGLPFRIVVALIVGGVALSIVVGYTITNSPFSKHLVVSVGSIQLEEGLGKEIEFTVEDEHGKPVKNAIVTCAGCNTVSSGKTDRNGKVTLHIDLLLPEHKYQDFLNVEVKARGYEDFKQENYIMVTKADYSTFLANVKNYAESFITNENNEQIIDEFPFTISGSIEKNDKFVYIVNPETANSIPDHFYISFQGNGLTNFEYKVIELYNEPFPDVNSINKIEWEDGFISWIPKEIQGSNCVYEVNLEHKSPRSLIIVVERKTDIAGNGEYTIYLDYEKHYSSFYEIFSNGNAFLRDLIEAIKNNFDQLKAFLQENYQNLVDFFIDPSHIDQAKREIIEKLYETLNEIKNLVMSIANEENIELAYKLLKSIQENLSNVANAIPGISSLTDVVKKLADSLNVNFYLILEPTLVDGFMLGIKFGYRIEVGTGDNTLMYDATGKIFIDYLIPELLPVPNMIIDGSIGCKINGNKGSIQVHSNINPFSFSERNYEVKVGIVGEISGTTGEGLEGKIGGKAAIGISFNNGAIIKPIKAIVSEIMGKYLQPTDDEETFRMEVTDTDDYGEFIDSFMFQALKIAEEIGNKIMQEIGEDVNIAVTFSGNGGIGVEGSIGIVKVDAVLIGSICFGINATLNGLSEIMNKGKEFVIPLIQYLTFQSILYACDYLGNDYLEEDINKIKDGAEGAIEKVKPILYEKGKDLMNTIFKRIYVGIDIGIGAEAGAEAGEIVRGGVSYAPLEMSGGIKINLGALLYLLSFGTISTDNYGVMLSLSCESSVSISGGAGVDLIVVEGKLGGETSFSTSKDIIDITIHFNKVEK